MKNSKGSLLGIDAIIWFYMLHHKTHLTLQRNAIRAQTRQRIESTDSIL